MLNDEASVTRTVAFVLPVTLSVRGDTLTSYVPTLFGTESKETSPASVNVSPVVLSVNITLLVSITVEPFVCNSGTSILTVLKSLGVTVKVFAVVIFADGAVIS